MLAKICFRPHPRSSVGTLQTLYGYSSSITGVRGRGRRGGAHAWLEVPLEYNCTRAHLFQLYHPGIRLHNHSLVIVASHTGISHTKCKSTPWLAREFPECIPCVLRCSPVAGTHIKMKYPRKNWLNGYPSALLLNSGYESDLLQKRELKAREWKEDSTKKCRLQTEIMRS